ncbi:37S ribosomal protein S10, mitochondrial [Vanrija pseudolonga]|uniref:Small ribosomal subunit protein uS10m n=1 Tax=Vanrija pseudolonga TaxID=143232 RepID=A0AAF0YFY9_9TREE|nr:37S ribosomal protein S10, mitochondrial [Vanrija pseudolonga]
MAASNRVMGSIGALARTARPSAIASTSSRASSSVAAANANSDPVVLISDQGILNFPKLKPVPTSHGIHVATIHLRAHHPANLDLYSEFAAHTAKSLRIPTSGIARLPTTKELTTVLKSPFVHKKAQENFERMTHRRTIKVFDTEREVVDLYLRYLRRNGIAGVGIKAYVHEFVEFGFARGEMADLQGQVKGKDETELEKATAEIVKALSQGLEFEDEPKVVAAPEAKEPEVVEAKKAEEKVESAEKVEKVEKVDAKVEAKAEKVEKAPAAEPAADAAEPTKSS